MTQVRWGRIFLFGVLAGIVWTLLSAVVLRTIGTGFVASLPPRSSGVRQYLLVTNVAAGVWVLWLYASIRAQHGPGLRTATITGVGWWVIQSLQSSKWVALGSVPTDVAWAAGLGTLPAMIAATVVGAWCYENYRPIRSLSSAP